LRCRFSSLALLTNPPIDGALVLVTLVGLLNELGITTGANR
jgi:hypothetical protein